MIDFKNIEYLKTGNGRQRLAYKVLHELAIYEKLKNYNPILAGTIPIGIDLPESDLDIICECENHPEFSTLLSELFENENEFEIYPTVKKGIPTTIARFKTPDFEIEIFGQNIPTERQNAFRHMLIEYKLLEEKGPEFKTEIIHLKSLGLKTEPAFAKLLGLAGDPYEELLNYV